MKNSKKVRLLFIGIVAVGVTMVAVLIGGLAFFNILVSRSNELAGGSGERSYDAYYALVTEESDTDFWRSILSGAKEMADENNIYLQIQQQELSQSMSKEDQMEMAIYSGVDGILLDGDESSSLSAMVEKAAAAGIPVVTIYHDCASSARISYVSISWSNMGREYGKQICSLLTERGESAEKLSVMVLLDASDITGSQNILLTGIREEIEKNGMGDRVNMETTLIHTGTMFSAQEEIRKLFSERKPADAFVCLDELSTVSVSQLVVDYNLVGNVEILGFHTSETIKAALDKKIIRGTLTADTIQMGRDGVEALTEYRESGYANEYYTSEISVVTAAGEGGAP
ncbi:MAG: substrate-binding domain-containing protein [Lachnospiraceae bacterium]|nr:substrate-binding domain-containing protein [Lachnospiraceae bacterium]